MNDEVLDRQVRAFLKKVGINSQREIERAVHEAVAAGDWPDGAAVNAHMRLSIPELGVEMEISEQIALE